MVLLDKCDVRCSCLRIHRRVYMKLYRSYIEGKYPMGRFDLFLEDLLDQLMKVDPIVSYFPTRNDKVVHRKYRMRDFRLVVYLPKKIHIPKKNLLPLPTKEDTPKPSSSKTTADSSPPAVPKAAAVTYSSPSITKIETAPFYFPDQRDELVAALKERVWHLEEMWPIPTEQQVLSDWFYGFETKCASRILSACLKETADKWKKDVLKGSASTSRAGLDFQSFFRLLYTTVAVEFDVSGSKGQVTQQELRLDIDHADHTIVTPNLSCIPPESRETFAQKASKNYLPHQVEFPVDILSRQVHAVEDVFSDPLYRRLALLWCLYSDFVFQHVDILRLRILSSKARTLAYPALYETKHTPSSQKWHIPILRTLLQPLMPSASRRTELVATILDTWYPLGHVHLRWYRTWNEHRNDLYHVVWEDLHALVQTLLHAKHYDLDTLWETFKKKHRSPPIPAMDRIGDGDLTMDTHLRRQLGLGKIVMEPFPWTAQPRSAQAGGAGDATEGNHELLRIKAQLHRAITQRIVRVGLAEHSVQRAIALIPKDQDVHRLADRFPDLFDTVLQQTVQRVRIWLGDQKSAIQSARARSAISSILKRNTLLKQFGKTDEEKVIDRILTGPLRDVYLTPASTQVRQAFTGIASTDPLRTIQWNRRSGVRHPEEMSNPFDHVQWLREEWKGMILSPEVEHILARYIGEFGFKSRQPRSLFEPIDDPIDDEPSPARTFFRIFFASPAIRTYAAKHENDALRAYLRAYITDELSRTKKSVPPADLEEATKVLSSLEYDTVITSTFDRVLLPEAVIALGSEDEAAPEKLGKDVRFVWTRRPPPRTAFQLHANIEEGGDEETRTYRILRPLDRINPERVTQVYLRREKV